MSKGTLIVMIGIPASGKSTFAQKYVKNDEIIVSRDEIRFSLLKKEDDYFSKENEVFKEFTKRITYFLSLGKTVYADATHLNPASRRKLFSAIKVDCKKVAVFISTPYHDCLKRNAMRPYKTKVPEEQLNNMYCKLVAPAPYEGWDEIYIYENDELRREK